MTFSPINKSLHKMLSSYQITFFGNPSKNGWNRKIGVLFLCGNEKKRPADWKEILNLAQSYFINECDVQGAVEEFMDNGCLMEMQYNDKIYGQKENTPYKLVNPQLN